MKSASWGAVTAALLAAACADADDAAPEVIGAELSDPLSEQTEPAEIAVADAAAPFDGALHVASTVSSIRILFDELLDGDSLQEIVRDPERPSQVLSLDFKSGIIDVIASDTALALPRARLGYDPSGRGIDIAFVGQGADADQDGDGEADPLYLPADTAIAIRVAGGHITDKAGNVMQTESAVAFVTAPVELDAATIPDYDGIDVPYDEPVLLDFNTAVDATSAAALITIIDVVSGEVTTTTVAADPLFPEELIVFPDAALAPATAYELRIDPGITDTYGVAYEGEPRLFPFETL